MIKAAYYATLSLYFYSFMFPGFPGGYNFILVMDIPCAGAGNAPALFLSRKLKEENSSAPARAVAFFSVKLGGIKNVKRSSSTKVPDVHFRC